VIFTTDAPTASGAATCDLGHQVTTVTAGTPVYANFFYKSRLTNETVTLTVIKDGTVLTTSTLTNDQANGIDCVRIQCRSRQPYCRGLRVQTHHCQR